MFQYKLIDFFFLSLCWFLLELGSWNLWHQKAVHNYGQGRPSHRSTHRPCPDVLMPSSWEKNVLEHNFRGGKERLRVVVMTVSLPIASGSQPGCFSSRNTFFSACRCFILEEHVFCEYLGPTNILSWRQGGAPKAHHFESLYAAGDFWVKEWHFL